MQNTGAKGSRCFTIYGLRQNEPLNHALYIGRE